MSGRFAIHDYPGIVLVICGIPIDDGRPKDQPLLVVNPPVQFEEEDSADGLVIRYPTLDRKYPMQLNLMSSSKCSAKLSTLHGLDTSTPGGAGVGPFLCIDPSGNTAMAGAQCYIKKAPNRSIARAPGVETWEVMTITDPAKMIFGGHEIV